MKKLFSYLLSAVAIMMGGAGMAVANPEVAAPGAATDPNAGKPLEGASADSPNKGIDQGGHAATGSAADQAGLVEKQITDYVDRYKAHKYPMAHDFGQLAKQIAVTVKDPTNWEIGEAILEASTIAQTAAADEEAFTVKVAAVDGKIFNTNGTLLVQGMTGYDETGLLEDGNPLMLLVTEKKGGDLTCVAINGKKSQTGDFKVLPKAIAAGTMLYAMAPAMSESEIEIEPDNVLPKQKQVYLQKKVCAITWTELFQRIEKKAAWSVQDIKDAALDRYKRKYTRTLLISAPSKFLKYNSKTGNEYAYTQNGIMRQMRLGYQLTDGQIGFNDLIAISSMLFGKYDVDTEVTAYCGSIFVQRLLNIDFKDHNEFTVRNYTDETTKIVITSFECNFGKIKFVHEYALDDLGYAECALLFNPAEAKHFYYQNGKTINIDHEKGEGGEVREAKTQYFVQDDCVELGGFNNMIVGPSELISGYKLSALDTMVSVADLANAPKVEGTIAYLTQDTNTNKMGLYKYEGAAWKPLDGKEIYVG